MWAGALNLDAWFRRGFKAFIEAFSAISNHPGVFGAVLTRNASAFAVSGLDGRGDIFVPTLLTLSAACEVLHVLPDPQSWSDAFEEVVQSESHAIAPTRFVYVKSGAAVAFKTSFTQALLNAGVAGVPSTLDEEGKTLALRIAINSGMRFLIAYAREATETPDPAFAKFRELVLA